jgi:hypothetical protein
MPNVTFNFRVANAASVQREIQRTLNATREGQRAVQGQSQQAATRSAAAEQAATRVVLAENAKRTQARQREVAAARTAEQQITAAVLSEDRKRTSAGTASQRARIRSLSEYVNAARAAEQQVTRVQQQEQRRRGAAWGQRASSAVSGAMGAGSTLHGQIQDARARRAAAERTAGLAFFQAGARTPAEIQARMRQATQFAASSGMSVTELLETANAAQTEFSSLQGNTEADRASAFGRVLETARLGRDTGNDPAQFARLQGMLAQAGFDDRTQRQALLYTAGASQRGAVEAGSLTREAMGPIMRRMSDASSALGPQASNEQRSAAALQAYREQVAELQVFRGTGFSIRNSGVALSNLQESLRSSSRQDKILNNIRTTREGSADPAQRARLAQLESTLYERDPTRRGNHQRLRADMQNPLAFVAAMTRATGGNATAIMNMLAGSGAGNAMSLLLNQRGLLGALAATNATGQSGADRVMSLLAPDVALTEQRVREGGAIFANDAQSQLNREETARAAALSDNTKGLVRLSNALAGFQASNPMLSTALGAGAGALLPAVAGMAGNALGGTAAAGAVTGAVSAGAAFAASAAGVLASAGVGLLIGDQIAQRMQAGGYDYSGVEGMEGVQVRRTGTEAQVESVFSGETWRELGRALGLGFNSTANSPQATVHAAALAATGANSVAPESRANR